MSKKVKIFVIVVLGIALIIGISVYVGGSTPPPASQNQLSSSASKAAGVSVAMTDNAVTEFSALLATIKNITIDTTLFTDHVYLSLRDYPIALGSDPKGRPNPFAPIGYDAGPITIGATTIQVQFETIQPNKITSTTAEFGAQAVVSSTDQTNVIFEYGTGNIFGSSTGPIPLNQNGTALFRVAGLVPMTTYYVRGVLTQGSIKTVGNTMTFTTAKAR